MDELIAARRSDAFWPVYDERSRDAAFVNPVLVFAERCVRDSRPVATVSDKRIGPARHNARPHNHWPSVARLFRNGAEVMLRVFSQWWKHRFVGARSIWCRR